MGDMRYTGDAGPSAELPEHCPNCDAFTRNAIKREVPKGGGIAVHVEIDCGCGKRLATYPYKPTP